MCLLTGPKPTLDQIAWVFAHLYDHAEQGGTYRHLIYDRMGFTMSSGAYPTLLQGLYITNLFTEYKALKDEYDKGYETGKADAYKERDTEYGMLNE